MKPLTIIRVVSLGNSIITLPELDNRFLNRNVSDLGSEGGRLWGSTTATQRYTVGLEATIHHGAIGFEEGVWVRVEMPHLGSCWMSISMFIRKSRSFLLVYLIV